jgi:Ca2+-binding RTX toxin-like protein
MAAITAEGRAELVALYMTMFGRAPTTLELARMVQAAENGTPLAAIAAGAAATPALEADFALIASMDAESFATYLADALLAADVPASAREWAENWVVTQVQGTKSKTQVIAEAVQAIRATDNPNYASSQAELAADVTAALSPIDNPTPISQTYTLTQSATDVVNGATSNDTIIGQLGQSVTLQSSDNINGGGGNDTFRVVTDGAGAQAAGGFTVTNVETLEVQAQAVGGSTLSLENVTGVSTIRSASSSADLTLNQVKSIAALEVQGALNAANLTVNYQTAATAGTADVQAISLNGNKLGTVTVTGIETVALSTGTAASTINAINAGATFSTLTVAGDKALTLTTALPNTVKTVDASAQTAGGINLTVGTQDVKVTGGAGNDTVTFTGTLTAADSFDGGEGRDTVVANVADLTANSYAAAAKISNVEIVQFADVLSANFDASKIAGEDTYVLASGYTSVTLDKVTDASTISIQGASAGNTLTVNIGSGDTAATQVGTANTLNISVGKAATNGFDAGTVVANGVETLNVNSVGDALTTGGNTLAITDAAATSLKVTGSEGVAITLTGTALTTLDASGSTGDNDFSLVTYKAATSATITGGAGADRINGSGAADVINGGAGADVIAGGGGADTLTGGDGVDTFSYSAVSDSSGAAQDTITDFVSGTDLINLQILAQSVGRTNIVLRNGSAADFGTAQASVLAGSGNTQVVYQADNNTLWVDVNDDGTLNNNDLAIKLTGVTKIVAADIGGTASPGGTGNFITVNAAPATVNTTTATGATAVTTAFGDTITSTLAFANGASIDGAGGNDTLVLTDAQTAALAATIVNVENLQLANVANTGVAFNTAGSFKNVTGGSAADTVNTASLIEGGTVDTGAGDDAITVNLFSTAPSTGGTSYKFNINAGTGNDTVTLGTALVLTADSRLNGGEGTDTLVLPTGANLSAAGSIAGFENLTLSGGAAVTMTTAQWADLTKGVVTGTGADSVTFSNAGTASAVAAVETYVAAAGGLTLNVGTVAVDAVVTGGAGTDIVNIASSVWDANDTFDGAAGTADRLNVTVNGDVTVIPANVVNVETVALTGTATTATTGVDVTFGVANTGLGTVDLSGLTNGGTIVMGALATAAQTINARNGGADVIDGSTVAAVNTTVSLDHGDIFDNNALTGTGEQVIKVYARDSGTTTVTIQTTADFDLGDLTLSLYKADGTQISVAAIAGALASGTVVAMATTGGTDTQYVIDANADGLYGVGDITINILGQNLTATDGINNGSITF